MTFDSNNVYVERSGSVDDVSMEPTSLCFYWKELAIGNTGTCFSRSRGKEDHFDEGE